jgi:thioredoxin-related protein
MKFLLPLLFISLTSFNNNDISPKWNTNYNVAFTQAAKEHKMILLNFSGSDWCGPCIKLHKEVFTLDAFNTIAEANLVLVNADFPRAKKNQLSKDQQRLNDELADKYNQQGDFPLTVLINQEGQIIKAWTGYPANVDDFINDLRISIAHH